MGEELNLSESPFPPSTRLANLLGLLRGLHNGIYIQCLTPRRGGKLWLSLLALFSLFTFLFFENMAV